MIKRSIETLKELLKNKEKSRACYAILHGSYKGDFIVYMGKTDKVWNFLRLPGMEPLEIPSDVMSNAIDKKIVDFIENLPKNIYKTCVKQYNESKSKDNISRLKQSLTSSGVDNTEREKERKS